MVTRLLFSLLCALVLAAPSFAQTITSSNPGTSTAGTPVSLIITGSNTNFNIATGAYLRQGNLYYMATSFTANTATNLSADFNLPPNAPLGNYQLGVHLLPELPNAMVVGVGPGSNYGYVSGKLNYDYNANCVIDPGEGPVPNRIISLGGQSVATDANGEYAVWLPLSNYLISTITAGPYELLNPCSASSVNLTVALDSVNNTNIYLDTLSVPELLVSINVGAMRPGFNANVWASVRNTGVTASPPVPAYIVLPPASQFSHTFPNAVSSNGDTVFFNVPALLPGMQYDMSSSSAGVNTMTPLGTVFTFKAHVDVVGGELLTNNNDQIRNRTVTGSYDPNDKRVWDEDGDNADGFILPSDSLLRYMVRFQNTGTDTAFNIYVEDTMSPLLDVATLTVEDASHNYTMSVNGTGNVKWTFPNILLVDSTTNEPLSHGFITYTIKRNPGLPNGAQIDNTAHIYFDFNLPIVTNTTSSVICPEISAGFSHTISGQLVTFTDTSSGVISNVFYDFGDGMGSTSPNATHTYAASGNYNVCYYVANTCGRLDSVCRILSVGCAPPVSGFNFTTNNLSASFTDVSTNAPTQWLWDFGDGNSSTMQNPTHTYANAGTYTVCLIANNTCGPDSTCQTVTVACAAPVAGFNSSVTGFSASFTDASTNAPTQWLWDFGDGNTSLAQNPTHTYANAGTYTVCLIANNVCGTDSSCQSVTIVCAPPVAAFGNSVSGFTATFTDMSTGAPTQWLWDFGDGNISTSQNPMHTYANAGTYTVCLIANNACGTDSTCQSVTASCVAPAAAFNSNPSSLNVTFSDQSTNSPAQWLWDFGDGNTSTAQNPNHSYAAPGTYTVCLIATNTCGSDSTCNAITVTCSAPSAVFSPNANLLTVNFINTSSGANTFGWDFGDGNTSTTMSPTHSYAAPGTYTVCLIASGPCGADTTCQSVTVNCAQPSAAFSNTISQTTVNFSDLSSGAPTTWAWDFGDGNTSNQQNPSHLYAAQGTYNVCLIVGGGCGSDTTCRNITIVCPSPSASFASSVNQLQVNFSDFSTNTTSWAWDFGDGNTSNVQNPTHNYAANGSYTVCLVSTNACGSDSTCQTVVATCALPAANFIFGGNALVFNFSNLSSNGTTFAWDFGDGAISAGVSPSHAYAAPGVYTVCLVATNGCGVDSFCTTVNASCLAPVSAFSFSGNVTSLNFTDNSSNTPTSWMWDFGDGNTSTMQNPTHSYAFVGNYNVCLTASSTCGTSTTCQFVNVGVGIGESFFNSFELYPNPARETVTLDVELAKVVHLELRLYDALGALIETDARGKVGGTLRKSFDLSSLPAGLYLLEVRVNGKPFTRKVTKQ